MLLSGVSKSAMQMNLERSSDSLFFERTPRARRVRRGMIDTYARPAAVRRRGEAPRVASRGEHGHSSVITQPVNRFCSDRDGRRGDDAARASLRAFSPRARARTPGQSRRRREPLRAHAMLSRRSQAELTAWEWVSTRTSILPVVDPEQSLNLPRDISFLSLDRRLRVEDTHSPIPVRH